MVRLTKQALKSLSEELEWNVSRGFEAQLDELLDDDNMALSLHEFLCLTTVSWLDIESYLAGNMSPNQWLAYHNAVLKLLWACIPEERVREINHFQMHFNAFEEVFRKEVSQKISNNHSKGEKE